MGGAARANHVVRMTWINACAWHLIKAELNPVKRLKCGKGRGVDGLQPEHIKYGGYSLLIWMQCIFNSIIVAWRWESLSQSAKGMICCNYRGITLTSAISKCLEIVVLGRLSPTLTVHKHLTDMTSLVPMLSLNQRSHSEIHLWGLGWESNTLFFLNLKKHSIPLGIWPY